MNVNNISNFHESLSHDERMFLRASSSSERYTIYVYWSLSLYEKRIRCMRDMLCASLVV